ncbi:MAG: diaminopimelate decarboxylase [Proteobacteria bacterium]|nr:diaminopimelate decarboxylase [Pseudomonadota bacterium]
MDHFQYRDGRLCAEAVPLARIAEEVGTPFYCYATATIERHYRVFADAFAGLDATICYAVKANSNIAVIGTLARLGAGADVVSAGELKRALAAGVPPGRIVFSGVGKTGDEMAAALKAGVLQINVESEPELDVLGEVAGSLGVDAPVAIRINPDVDANTHEKITTGKSENKFGVEWTRARAVYSRAAAMPAISVVGIAVHIGSQVTDLAPFRDAYVRMRDLVAMLRADGHSIERLDLGGGLGIPYGDEVTPTPEEYAATVKSAIADLDCHIILEPGRVIVGNAGVLVTRVVHVKEGAMRTFVIVDAAMNDLLRPALYNATHAIVPVTEAAAGTELMEVDVVGPICETADTFGSGRLLPAMKPGDLLAVRTAGAYGAVMASTYNARPLVPETLVKDATYAVVRERMSVDDMVALESFPPWLAAPDKAAREAGG